jgi:hypothetical protein
MDKIYDTPPKHLRSLEQRLRNLSGTNQVVEARVKNQLGKIAIIGCLSQDVSNGKPVFLVKGGTAIELLLGLNSRSSKDLDASYLGGNEQELKETLTEALVQGWQGFTFVLNEWNQIKDFDSYRAKIKVAYNGKSFKTITFEVALAEGEAGQKYTYADNLLIQPAKLGLKNDLNSVPIVAFSYMLAQKLHACTDHSNPNWDNDRARDLIDILLVRELLEDQEIKSVKLACQEIFSIRSKQSWPPEIKVLANWPEIYKDELVKIPDFEPDDVYLAAEQVNAFIQEINNQK